MKSYENQCSNEEFQFANFHSENVPKLTPTSNYFIRKTIPLLWQSRELHPLYNLQLLSSLKTYNRNRITLSTQPKSRLLRLCIQLSSINMKELTIIAKKKNHVSLIFDCQLLRDLIKQYLSGCAYISYYLIFQNMSPME